MDKRNYVFRGLLNNGEWVEVCIRTVRWDVAWQQVVIDYPEFIKIEYVCDYQ